MEGESTPMTPLKRTPGYDDSGFAFSPGQTPWGQTPSSPAQVQTHRNGVSPAKKRLEFEPDTVLNIGVIAEEEEERLRSSEEPDPSQAGPSRDKWAWTKGGWMRKALISVSAFLAISVAINLWQAVSLYNKCRDNDMKPKMSPETPKLQLCASLPFSMDVKLINGTCYFVSKEKKTWHESKKFCESHNGTLPNILDQDILDTIRRYKIIDDLWIGLRKINKIWEWLNGTLFSNSLLPLAPAQDVPGLDCAYLNEKEFGVLECTTERHFICTI